MKKKIEYIISITVSLILLEIGFFYALAWYWSGFEWSPFGYETCGLEFIAILLLTYPAFWIIDQIVTAFSVEISSLYMVFTIGSVRYCFLRHCQIP